MKKPKLTRTELSLILSQQAVGKLAHSTFYNPISGCGCVAGTAMNLEAYTHMGTAPDRAVKISKAIHDYDNQGLSTFDFRYPSDPDEMLRLLEDRGLA